MKKYAISFMAMIGLSGCGLMQKPPPVPTYEQVQSADFGRVPYDAESIVRNFMGQRLKDPNSARYDQVVPLQKGYRVPRDGFVAWGQIIYGFATCYKINAKNSYGGYTGDQLYYFFMRNDEVIYYEGESSSGILSVARSCGIKF